MQITYKSKIIDIRLLKWGGPPAPLLPSSLRAAWRYEILPNWVCAETGLPKGATVVDLSVRVWEAMEIMSPRLRHFLLFMMRTHAKTVEKLRCVERIWPVGLKVGDIGWTVRTRNCLARKGLLDDEQRLINLTFGDVVQIEGMGTMTILDFCSTLEGAVDIYEQLATSYAESRIEDKPTDLTSILEEAVREDWSAQISKRDPRFASLLPPGEGTLQERIEQLLLDTDTISNVSDIPLLLESISKIQQMVAELQVLPLESCLRDFLRLASRTEGERLHALVARLGWHGERPATLEECGKRLGLTRERVRQIQDKILKRFPDHEVLMPRLDEALDLLEERAPLTMSEASQILRDASITKCAFHPQSLLDAAGLLGKQTTLQICDTRSGKMLVNEPSIKVAQFIPVIARKLAGQSGVTSVFQIADALAINGHEVEEKDLRRMLHANENFEFLDEDWFWAKDVPEERNRLRNSSRKILSVVSPQAVRDIRDGVRRAYRYRITSHERYATLIVPPLDVMTAFFERHPNFKVDGDYVSPSMPLDYRKELGETDCILVEVLRSSPTGVMDRTTFAERCLARGMNENTFSIYSSYSCILEHVGIGIWKLRGLAVDPAAVEAVRIANHLKPREKRVLEHGWTNDGKLWIAARVPRLAKQSMVIGCPGAIQRYLAGQEFKCSSKENGHPCGTVVINEKGTSYGYGLFIRRYGLDENDVLLAEFDLATNTVTLSLADDELPSEAA